MNQFTLASNKLGANYTKEALNNTVWRYSYFKNRQNDDDDSGDYKNQISTEDGTAKYSHVFLKFKSDGSLVLNINPYWNDEDKKAYENSKNNKYDIAGTWHVSSDGKVDINWADSDTGAYAYETVRVKVKTKHHHHKYKSKQKLTPQFLDSYGNPDTSLPRYYRGDSIHGKVTFGVDAMKIDGVVLQKPDKDGYVPNIPDYR